MRINPTPQQLAAFVQLAESGSFGEAARRLGVSQPALTRTIQLLEAAIGQRLFDRTTRRVALTPMGEELRPIVARLLAEFEGAFAEVAQFAAGQRGRITVAALPSVAAVLLPPAIARFGQSHPAVQFTVHDNLSGPVADAVLQGRADLGLTVRPPDSAALAYAGLTTDAFGLVCRRDDPLAAAEEHPWSIFATRRFVAMSSASSVRAMTDAVFLQGGLAVQPHFECAFLATTGHLVSAGLGITALPRLTLPLLGVQDLVWRRLRPRFTRQIGVVTRLGRSASPAAAAFLHALAAAARDLPAPG